MRTSPALSPNPPSHCPPPRPRPSFPRWTPAPSAWMPTSPASATPSPRTRPSQPTSRRPPRRAPAPAWLALPSTPSNGPRSCRESSTARSGQTGSCWRLMGAKRGGGGGGRPGRSGRSTRPHKDGRMCTIVIPLFAVL
eukprot:scaffold30207_cov76-Isochrysis_galbana.AAC.2